MDKIGQIVTSYPKRILAFFLLITVFFAIQLFSLSINNSTNILMEKDAHYRIAYESSKEIFGNEEVILLVFEDKELFSYETLKKLKWLTESIEQLNYIKEVKSIINTKHIEGKSGSLAIKPLFSDIPKKSEEILELKNKALKDRLFVDNIVSRDGNSLALIIYMENTPEEEIYKNKTVEGSIKNIKDLITESGIKSPFYLGGSPILRTASGEYMFDALIKYGPFTGFLLFMILFLAFKTLRGVLIPIATVTLSLIWTVGFMVLVGKEINIVTIIIPNILLIMGCAYSSHFMNQYYVEIDKTNSKDSREIVLRTINHVGQSLLYITITTIAGFISLGVSKIVPITELGIFLSFGISCFIPIIFLFIPSVLTLLPPKKSPRINMGENCKLSQFLYKLGEFNKKRAHIIIIFTVLLSFLSIVGIGKIKVETDNLSFFKEGDRVKIDNRKISKSLAGINVMTVVLKGEKKDTFKNPNILKKVVELQNYIESFKEVDSSRSIADFIQEMNAAIHENDETYRKIPDNKNFAAQILFLYSFENAKGDLDRFVDYDYKNASVTYRVNTYNMKFYLELADKIKAYSQKIFPDNISVDVTGSLMITAKAFDMTIDTQIKSLLIAFTIIIIFMFFLFRSFKLGLVLAIPNIVPILFTFGVMGWLNIRLDLSTCVFSCIALGIVVDDTIHYSLKFIDELKLCNDPQRAMINSLQLAGRPILTTSVAISSGFLVLTLSNFVPIIIFGFITTFVMMVACLVDLTLTPVLLTWYSQLKE